METTDLVERAANLADVLGLPASARLTRAMLREALAEVFEEGHSDGYGQGYADGYAGGGNDAGG